ncbi:hypothetical protein [Nannocystis pusilla]|uniref:hypothetical protein n=1 Tax=Nannocystis pusilla TaxID=889268 RepID=UPI003B7AF5BD
MPRDAGMTCPKNMSPVDSAARGQGEHQRQQRAPASSHGVVADHCASACWRAIACPRRALRLGGVKSSTSATNHRTEAGTAIGPPITVTSPPERSVNPGSSTRRAA